MRYVAIIDGSVTNGFERAGDAASFARQHAPAINEEDTVLTLKSGEPVVVRSGFPRVVLRKA